MSDLETMIFHIDDNHENLTPWEINFIANFVDRIHAGEKINVSFKQREIVERLYDECG